MAHTDTILELAPGLNVLIGPNNAGKSAIVEALRSLSTNSPSKGLIRHNAKKAEVEIELEDETLVTWVRSRGSGIYKVFSPGTAEEVVYAKCARATPAEIEQLIKIGPIKMEGESVDIHLGSQREPLFPLNLSGTTLAAFFASTSESAHVLAMQKLLQQKRLGKTRERSLIRKNLEMTANSFEKLSKVPELAENCQKLRSRWPELVAKENELLGLEKLIAALLKNEQEICWTKRKWRISGKTKAPPKLRPSKELAILNAELFKLEQKNRQQTLYSQTLNKLPKPPLLKDLRPLSELIAKLFHIRGRVKKGLSYAARLKNLPEPPDAKKLRLTAKLGELLNQTHYLQTEIEKARIHLEKISLTLQKNKEFIESRLRELGNCPLCGATLEAQAFFSGLPGTKSGVDKDFDLDKDFSDTF